VLSRHIAAISAEEEKAVDNAEVLIREVLHSERRGGKRLILPGIIKDMEKGKTINFVLSEDGILYASNSTENARTVIP
jgi:hypothetical protein